MIRYLSMISVVSFLSVFGCGSEESSSDPRCEAICAIDEPSLEGAYDICSQESADACKAECGARIETRDSLCTSCLLEEACFDCDDDVVSGDTCENGTCTTTGREGSCTYPEGDEGAREDCLRQVYPRRAVTCEYEFRPVTECADLCQQ